MRWISLRAALLIATMPMITARIAMSGIGGAIAVLLARENVLEQVARHEHLRAEADARDELEAGRDQQLAWRRAPDERDRAHYELGEIPQTSLPGGRQGLVEAEFAPCRLILRARFGRV